MCRRAVAILIVLTCSTAATADKYVQTAAPRLLCVPPAPTEHCIELPPGRFVDEARWQAIDVELRAAQDAKTRLTAENASLKQSLSGWSPGWVTLASVLAAGIAGGVYISQKL